jgi:hypothetical protein
VVNEVEQLSLNKRRTGTSQRITMHPFSSITVPFSIMSLIFMDRLNLEENPEIFLIIYPLSGKE